MSAEGLADGTRSELGRAGLGILTMMIALGLLTLLPAGTTRFWRAWVYLAVFGGSTIAITTYLVRYDRALLARRLDAGPIAERDPAQKLFSAIANVGFVALFVVAGLDRRFRWSAVPAVASVVADAAVVLGFVIVFFTFRANSYTSATITVAERQSLVDEGPYSVVRHPMYAGAFVMLVATPIALGSWRAFPAVLLMLLAIVARLIGEERYLLTHLDGYECYRRRVRFRIVPHVW